MGIYMMFKIALAAIGVDAKWSLGQCPKMTYIKDFNAEAYAGRWYEQVRDMFNPYTISTDCVTKEFAKNKDGDVDLYFRGYYWMMLRYMGVSGTMYQCDEGSPTTWTCQATMEGGSHRSPIRVWETDYENFDIMYECSQHGWFKNEMFSVAARTPHMSEENWAKVKAIVHEKMPSYDIDRSYVMTYP